MLNNTKLYFPVSAKSIIALKSLLQHLQEYLRNNLDICLYSLSYTLSIGRDHYSYRQIFVATSITQLLEQITAASCDLVCQDSTGSADSIISDYLNGCNIVWNTVLQIPSDIKIKILELPCYPFDVISFWLNNEYNMGIIKTQTDPLHELANYGYQAILIVLAEIISENSGIASFTQFQQDLSKFCLINKIAPKFQELLAAWSYEMSNANLLNHTGITTIGTNLIKNCTLGQVNTELTQFAKNMPDYADYAELLQICCNNYKGILQEQINLQELLLQNSQLFTNVYGNAKAAHALNASIVVAIAEILKNWPKNSKKLRILEIGAGTGATTRAVLNYLQKSEINWHYTWTDISLYFVEKAQGNFKNVPFEFAVLNIEQIPNDFHANYDIIIATNVLHATKVIDNTLNNVRSLLAKQGYLVAGEVTIPQPFLTQTFGLFDGWWYGARDAYRITHSPLLTKESWQKLLAAHGFLKINVIAADDANWQNCFIAQHEGNVMKIEDLIINVRNIVAEVIGKPSNVISTTKNFAEYGVDSLIVVVLIGALNRKLNLQLRATHIFDYPTIVKLAEYIYSSMNLGNFSEAQSKTVQTLEIESEFTISSKLYGTDPALLNHTVQGVGLLPIDGWFNIILQGLKNKLGNLTDYNIVIENMFLVRPLFCHKDSIIELEFHYKRESTKNNKFNAAIKIIDLNRIELVCEFDLTFLNVTDDISYKTINYTPNDFVLTTTEKDLYCFEAVHIGDKYRIITQMQCSNDGFSCVFKENYQNDDLVNQAVIYNALVSAAILFPYFSNRDLLNFYVPIRIKKIVLNFIDEPIVVGYGTNRSVQDGKFIFDLACNNASGNISAYIEGLEIAVYKEPNNKPETLIDDKSTTWQANNLDDDSIAIVGMSGRFGHAHDLNEFWDYLQNAESLVTEVPSARKHFFDKQLTESLPMFKAGYLDAIDCFDNEFFELSKQESEYMEPQQRLFLQEAYRAFEDAGYTFAKLQEIGDRCGVFVGASSGDYLQYINSLELPKKAQVFWGISSATIAGRIAYFFDLHGPAMTIDTACSSSLVAIHQACQSIKNGETEVALVGGVFVLVTPEFHSMAKNAGMLAPDGACKTFDSTANGFVPGESVCAIVVKPLQHALRDGNKIYAIIKGTRINQDGRTNTITAPSSKAQANLITSLYSASKINPEHISYVEAHGTGTALGDPIEIEGLNAAFKNWTTKKQFCTIGSVKSNIGHCATAAGLVGLIKTVLAINKQIIPASLHFKQPNNHINFADTPFKVAQETAIWQADLSPRMAAISAFGFSGTNAHVIISEFKQEKLALAQPNVSEIPIIISAHSLYSLQHRIIDLFDFIKHENNIDLQALAYTLACCRNQLHYCMILIIINLDDLKTKLSQIINKQAYNWYLFGNKFLKEDCYQAPFFSQLHFNNIAEYNGIWADKLLNLLNKQAGKVFEPSDFASNRIISLPIYKFMPIQHWLLHDIGKIVNVNKYNLLASAHRCGAEQMALLPGMAIVAMFYEYIKQDFGIGAIIEDFCWYKPIQMTELNKIIFKKQGNSYICGSEQDLVFATATCNSNALAQNAYDLNLLEIIKTLPGYIRKQDFYKLAIKYGILYEPILQGIEWLAYSDHTAIAFINLSNQGNHDNQELTLAQLLDVWIQPIIQLHAQNNADPNVPVYLPANFKKLVINKELMMSRFSGYSYIRYANNYIDAWLLDENYNIYAQLQQLEIKPAVYLSLVNTTNLISKDSDIIPDHNETNLDLSIIRARVIKHLTEIIARVLRIEPQKISINDSFSKFGLDSALMVNLIEELELDPNYPLTNLSKTLFFDCPTFTSLVDYLENHNKIWFMQFAALTASEPEELKNNQANNTAEEVQTRYAVSEHLRQVISRVLRIEIEKIKIDDSFSKFGLDSALMVNLIEELELDPNYPLTNLAKTLFFDCPNFNALIDYLQNNHPQWFKQFKVDKKTLPTTMQGQERTIYSVAEQVNDIAVIGMYGEYGSYRGNLEYWQALYSGEDNVRPVPLHRCILWDVLPDQAENIAGYVGSWLEDIEYFDSLNYDISPKQATAMDPQERKFLDAVRLCVEESGYLPSTLENTGMVGMFVGAMYGQYELYAKKEPDSLIPNSFFSTIANRVSYTMNWKGPSIALDTMCSSSLTAIHLGCESIKRGECKVAVVGGINIASHIRKFDWLKENHFLAIGGKCKSFGLRDTHETDGYVPGEGVGVLILKPLVEAINAKDMIWGIIKGTAINHNGHTTGYTAPNTQAQTAVINEAISRAKINKEEISYIEAHGTGTALGDPIEIQALNAVFKQNPTKVTLGSVKSNLGHLEAAAGIAGISKVLLQMHYRKLVPSLHSKPANAYINFENLEVQTELTDWEHNKLIAGVSAFGAGGANAHIVLQNYNAVNDAALQFNLPGYVLFFSARTKADLKNYLKTLSKWWQDFRLNTAFELSTVMASLSWILGYQRQHHQYRVACLVKNEVSLETTLTTMIARDDLFLNANLNNSEYIITGIVPDIIENDPLMEDILIDIEQFFADQRWQTKDLEIFNKKLRSIAQLYCRGYKLPQLFGHKTPPRINVPGIYHKGEAYWINSNMDLLKEIGRINLRSKKYLQQDLIKHDLSKDSIELDNSDYIVLCAKNHAAALEIEQKYVVDIYNDNLTVTSLEALSGSDDRPLIVIDFNNYNIDDDLNFNKIYTKINFLQQIIKSLKSRQIILVDIIGHNKDTITKAFAKLILALNHEYKNVNSIVIDILDIKKFSDLKKIIVNEIRAANLQVKYSNNMRYVLSENIKPLVAAKAKPQFSAEHVYIITGGLGDVGQKVILYLAQSGAKKIAIFGKSAKHLKLPLLEKFKLLGINLIYNNPRLDKIEELSASIVQIQQNYGEIAGVFHLAGTQNINTFSFINKSSADWQAIIDPKVYGVANLFNILQQKSLKFFIAFSSISTVYPELSVGLTDYVFANSLMDALIEKQQLGTNLLCSIQWPAWQHTALGDQVGQKYHDLNLLPLKLEDCYQILDSVFENNINGIITPVKNSNYSVTTTSTNKNFTMNWLLDFFIEELQLKPNQITNKTDFKNLGVDSIIIVDLMKKLEKHLNKKLNPDIFLTNSNIEKLYEFLC